MIDYPGKVSCVIFLSGCNFDCPYCHNPELAKGSPACPSWLEDKTLYDFLENRKGLLDGVVISGGEPTLQKDLVPLCRRLKRMGYPIKLDTNGSRPRILKELIDVGLIDYIAMDVKTDPFHYSPLIKKDCDPVRLLLSIQVIMESGLPYEFRTTCVKPLVTEDVIENIGKIIQGANLYALQGFHETDVLHPEFFQGKKAYYDKNELMVLKSIAEPWVRECIVR
jgi:pyruvate formate lyase activating enzyme